MHVVVVESYCSFDVYVTDLSNLSSDIHIFVQSDGTRAAPSILITA